MSLAKLFEFFACRDKKSEVRRLRRHESTVEEDMARRGISQPGGTSVESPAGATVYTVSVQPRLPPRHRHQPTVIDYSGVTTGLVETPAPTAPAIPVVVAASVVASPISPPGTPPETPRNHIVSGKEPLDSIAEAEAEVEYSGLNSPRS